VSRRVSLPGADELFRSTRRASPHVETPTATAPPAGAATPADEPRAKGPSGRVRHDEKITVYVTADELHDLEATRLLLRRDYGLSADRGRIVREAIHLALAGVESDGDSSPLIRRLREPRVRATE
jgi:hypothetical protein